MTRARSAPGGRRRRTLDSAAAIGAVVLTRLIHRSTSHRGSNHPPPFESNAPWLPFAEEQDTALGVRRHRLDGGEVPRQRACEAVQRVPVIKAFGEEGVLLGLK